MQLLRSLKSKRLLIFTTDLNLLKNKKINRVSEGAGAALNYGRPNSPLERYSRRTFLLDRQAQGQRRGSIPTTLMEAKKSSNASTEVKSPPLRQLDIRIRISLQWCGCYLFRSDGTVAGRGERAVRRSSTTNGSPSLTVALD